MLVGQLQEAKHCYECALSIREKTFGKHHSTLAGLLSNLGVLYMELGELQKSKDFQYRALNIRLHDDELGFNHYKTGDCVLNLGLVLEQCDEVDEAARPNNNKRSQDKVTLKHVGQRVHLGRAQLFPCLLHHYQHHPGWSADSVQTRMGQSIQKEAWKMERHCRKWARLFQHGIAKKPKEEQETFENHSKREHKRVGLYMFFLCTSLF
ncbi:hypothetical protein ACROYT_G038284 [Oculina patagonica]